jgi:hypothetical protein
MKNDKPPVPVTLGSLLIQLQSPFRFRCGAESARFLASAGLYLQDGFFGFLLPIPHSALRPIPVVGLFLLHAQAGLCLNASPGFTQQNAAFTDLP